ncbi:MAG: efflux RND transporter periplasmic adaptor subunit [Colwellia sp.]|nr:efflux RND transporter periplasmic adaptor subunit [Colwellia sp.]
MSQLNHHQPDISQLKIDRTPRNNKIWRSAYFTNAVIVMMICVSALYLSAGVFIPTSDIDKTQVKPVIKTANKNLLSASIDSSKAVVLNNNQVKPSDISKLKTILDASGHIVARRIATVSSQVTGKLNKLNIEEGQRVYKSDVLAELDNKQAVITHQLTLAELAAKRAGLEELELLFKQQNKRFNRNKLLAKQQLISEQLLEDSQFKNAQLAIQMKNKQALVQLAQQRVALAQYQLSQHQIRAPFDGVVISKNAQVGELISAGSSGGGFIRTGVGTIVDMSSLEIEVEVGESYIHRVFAGQKVIAKLDAYPKWQIHSEVVAIIPTADRQKASIKVRVKFFEIDPRILPDMGVKVSFINQEAHSDEKEIQTHVAVL